MNNRSVSPSKFSLASACSSASAIRRPRRSRSPRRSSSPPPRPWPPRRLSISWGPIASRRRTTRRSWPRGPNGTRPSSRSRSPQAGLRPSVSFGGSATLESDDVNEPPGAKSDTYSNLSLSLDATQPLYRLDRTIRLGQARTREEKAKADYAVRTQQLIERVVERYFGVLQARDDFRFAETNREAIGQQLRQAQERFEVGLIAVTDVEEAKSRFDLASAREIEAKNGLDNAREAMRETIGEYPEELAALGADIPLAVPDPADIDAWTDTALERNLPIRSASLAVAIAKEEIRIASAGAQPTVDLVGRAAATDKNRKPTGGSEAVSASIGIRLNLPLYTGGRVSAETREARARHRESMHVQETGATRRGAPDPPGVPRGRVRHRPGRGAPAGGGLEPERARRRRRGVPGRHPHLRRRARRATGPLSGPERPRGRPLRLHPQRAQAEARGGHPRPLRPRRDQRVARTVAKKSPISPGR